MLCSLLGGQYYFQGSTEDAGCGGASARVPLKIVTIKKKAAVKTRSTASPEAILVPVATGEIEKDFIVREKVPPIMHAEGSINHETVAIADG